MKKARWLAKIKRTGNSRRLYFECANCRYKSRNQTKFCPECGYSMVRTVKKNDEG